MKEQFIEIISRTQARHVLVEAAHVYGYESFGPEHFHGAQIGAEVLQMTADLGLSCSSILFVDDYNRHKSLTPEAYINNPDVFKAAITEQGFVPDALVFEKAFAAEAEVWAIQLTSAGLFKTNKKGIFLPLGGDGLLWIAKKESSGYHFTCEALDALCYLHKAKQADLLVTVLPSS